MYYRCQQEYLRKRLLAIKYLYERKTRTEVSDLLNCHSQTLSTWIDKFLEGGLKNLLELMTHQVSSRLNIEQKQELKIMILEELPRDYVVDRNKWSW
ncbi:hypothetical protein Tery_1059 [Trichodesmium erythraeum IMS101]|uniref:Transposase n=1 Tax=Trichodesmium erythraeum (strain IMS101) TaxID=203124 RepID=Q116Z4_TRIEI